MAHSIQEFHGRYVTLNDLDIVASVALLHLVTPAQSDDTPSAVLARWDRAVQNSGPGTIDLELEEIVRSPEERDHVLKTLEALRARAAGFGDKIPASVLTRTTSETSTRLNDYPSKFIVDFADALEGLLRQNAQRDVAIGEATQVRSRPLRCRGT